MNTAIPDAQEYIQLHTATPNFLGIVRGEFLKISRLWQAWIMLLMLLGGITLPYLVSAGSPGNMLGRLKENELVFFYNEAFLNLAVLRVFSGFFLLIMTAYIIGQEYQSGTIRILLARGVGRLQLLLAKLLTMSIIALALLMGGILVNIALSCIVLTFITGSLNALHSLTPLFWSNVWLYLLTVLISMGVTILLAAAVSLLGRMLAFGLSAAIAWFAIDNFGLLFLVLAYRATHADFWLNLSTYALGPNLNVMGEVVLPAQLHAETIGVSPLTPVDGTHTLLLTLVYALIFAGASVILAWKRDVKE